MSTVTFSNGKTLTSSALTQSDAENALQGLITTILGADTDRNGAVRISWPTSGQPAWAITDDICFLRATLSDERVNRQRDKARSGQGEAITETVKYVRVWQIDLVLYGPNSFDHARLLKSALYMDWVTDTLATSDLATVIDFADPRRMPELFAGQWWERSDLSFQLNELVTETTTVPAMSSVEIDVCTEDSTAPRVISLTA